MAVLETTTDDVAAAPASQSDAHPEGSHPTGSGTPIRVAAVALWGVVGSLLGYGVLQTVLKASALFG
jgi:hypothetical protein